MSKHKKNKNSGITLIALVVTIIVLLILAGISIQMLTGDNGIIKRAGEAKERTERVQEEECANLTFTEVQIELSQGKKVDLNIFQSMIDRYFGTNNATGHIGGNSYIITVTRTNNNYQMDTNGKISKLDKIPIDFEPGVLEQSGNTYTINSIEDLVAFAYNVNSGQELYDNKLVTLGRNLDFKGHADSYVNEDSKYKVTGLLCLPDDNSSTSIRDLMTNEEKYGFIPIGGFYAGNYFKGTFDGKGNVISNIFSNVPVGGLFGQIDPSNVKVMNLSLINCNIKSSSGPSGGIVGSCMGSLTIDNCFISGTMSGSVAGGIVGSQSDGELKISNSTNNASVTSTNGPAGGIVGVGTGKIYNCSNSGTINGTAYLGGIVGLISNSTISNCYNTSNIEGKNVTGGIVGSSSNVNISNCCNEGIISATSYDCGGIVGELYGTGNLNKCYNFKTITGSGHTGGIVGSTENYIIDECYNSGDIIGSRRPVGGISGSNGTITNCYNVGVISGENNNSNIGEIVGDGSTNNTSKYLKRVTNANANGASEVEDKNEMNNLISVYNYISLINTDITKNNLDNTKDKLKMWKVENGLPVFNE